MPAAPSPRFFELDELRRTFRDALQQGPTRTPGGFAGRVGVVLSGGGARGAYEAGVLLAFQDARVPTDIISATSIGSVNAASYAAHSKDRVGNAEPLVASWLDLTPRTLGIEWTRYGWMIAGLIAVSAGIGNLAYYLLTLAGFRIHLHHPAAAWSSLALAGFAVLAFHPQLPYVWFVIGSLMRRVPLRVDRRRLGTSIAANLLVGLFLVAGTEALHLHTAFATLVRRHPLALVAVLLVLLGLRRLQRSQGARLGRLWERVIRLALHSGLFKNFERSRYLRARIPEDGLLASPIRLLFTATDLAAGRVRYFSNAPPEQLGADRDVDMAFIARSVAKPDDPLGAIIASSALPITYEPMDVDGRMLADGAVMGSQPVRPAIRLGADVLFLVLLEPEENAPDAAGTFVDVGARVLSILMHQNLSADLRELRAINGLCVEAARGLGIAPEAVEIQLGERRMRYVRPFVIRPDHSLGLSIHDFGGPGTREAILSGYQDASRAITAFLQYAAAARFDRPRRVLRLTPTA